MRNSDNWFIELIRSEFDVIVEKEDKLINKWRTNDDGDGVSSNIIYRGESNINIYALICIIMGFGIISNDPKE